MADKALPTEAALFEVFSRPRAAQARAQSTLAPFEERTAEWLEDGIRATTIHQTLKARFGYTGSYSSVRQLVHNA